MQDDILRKFEFKVRDFLVSKGYVVGDGTWEFKTELSLKYKSKILSVFLSDEFGIRQIFSTTNENTGDMFKNAFTAFGDGEGVVNVM